MIGWAVLVTGAVMVAISTGGWWAVPLVAAVAAALIGPARRPLAVVTLGSLAGWAILVARAAIDGGFMKLDGLLAGMLPGGALGIVGLGLVVAGGTGLGGALIGTAIAEWVRRPRRQGG